MPILAYHMVDPRLSFGVTRVTPKQFEKQIQFLIEHDFEIVTISDYLQSNDFSRVVALTFDDAYESVFEYAFPILQKYKVAATVFVNPAFVGHFNTWDVTFGKRVRHMKWSQIGVLKDNGWEVGSHGQTHRDLTRLSEELIEWELAKSAFLIARITGNCSVVFSYPFGNMNDKVAKCAQKLNYQFGLTMGMLNKNTALNFTINRTGIYRFDNAATFRLKACGQFSFLFRVLQQILDTCSDATVACRQKNWMFY